MTAQANGHEGQDLSQDQMFVRAVRIATNAHKSQLGKDGRPYIEHCERVAMRVAPSLRPIAYLHDVVEKSEGWTLDRLRLDGFPEDMIAAIDALTRRDGEDEEAFVLRAAFATAAEGRVEKVGGGLRADVADMAAWIARHAAEDITVAAVAAHGQVP